MSEPKENKEECCMECEVFVAPHLKHLPQFSCDKNCKCHKSDLTACLCEGIGCPKCEPDHSPQTPDSMDWEKEFIEKGADLEHARWARWQKYLHSLCDVALEHVTDMPHCWCNPQKEVQPNGNMVIVHDKFTPITIPFERVKHWERQIATPYSELTEQEKEYDRKETRTYLPLVRNLIARAHSSGRREAVKDMKHLTLGALLQMTRERAMKDYPSGWREAIQDLI